MTVDSIAVPSIMSYAEWLLGTGRVRDRSSAAKAVDLAFQRFEWKKTMENFLSLKQAFLMWIAFLDERGMSWRRIPENKQGTVERFDRQIRQWAVLPIEPLVRIEDRVHTRLGLVYLFSHLRVNTTSSEVLAEALVSVATLGLGYHASGDQAVYYAKLGVGASKSVVSGIAASIEDWVLAPASPSIYDAIPKEATWQEQLAMGYQITRQAIADALRNALKSISDVFREKLKPFFVDPMGIIGASVREKLLPFIAEATAAIGAMLEKQLQPYVDDLEGKVSSMVFGQIRPVAELVVGTVAAALLPILTSAWDTVKGIIKTIDAGIDRYRFWAKEHIQIANGHPAAIMQSIRHAMNVSLGDGLATTISGAGRLTGEVLSAGAGKIVSMVLKMVESLIRAFVKIVEIEQLNQFIREAKQQWEKRDAADALHKRESAFDKWYRGNAMTLPIISVLSLNSGLAGDKTQFLAGLSTNRDADFQKFAEGAAHVDSLKAWGVSYLNNVRINLSGIDAQANGYLAIAKGHIPDRTLLQSGWQAVTDLANGVDFQRQADRLTIPGSAVPVPALPPRRAMMVGRSVVKIT
jgi:hypothetical protein